MVVLQPIYSILAASATRVTAVNLRTDRGPKRHTPTESNVLYAWHPSQMRRRVKLRSERVRTRGNMTGVQIDYLYRLNAFSGNLP